MTAVLEHDVHSLLEPLRSATVRELSHADSLTEIILRLGVRADPPEFYPAEIQRRAGRGLNVWHYPRQLADFWIWLKDQRVARYLEIGLHGNTLAATAEYLRRFGAVEHFVGIDGELDEALAAYAAGSDVVRVAAIDPRRADMRLLLCGERPFDAVMIDGNHEEGHVRQDYELAKSATRIVVFHDACNDLCPGVVKVWGEVRSDPAVRTIEFFEQYPHLSGRRSYMGIGVAVMGNRRAMAEGARP